MKLCPDHVGRRLTVRLLAGGTGPTGRPAMTDVVGRLLNLDEHTAVIERRDGSLARVDLARVVTAKVLPERPMRPRRATAIDAAELSAITSRGWPAIESVPLGDWELRASSGFTGRANSVAVHGDPGRPFGEALDAVRGFYAARDQQAVAQVVVGTAHDDRFRAAGWRRLDSDRAGASVQVAQLDRSWPADPHVRVSDVADDAWLAHYGRVSDPELARRVIEGPHAVAMLSLGEPTVAIGRVVVTGEWAGLSAVEVDPDQRRRGLARRIVQTSLAWAITHGADKAYVQTMPDNAAALALYASFGFVDHHEYTYLTPEA